MNTRRTIALLALLVLVASLFAIPGLGQPQWFNGVSSWAPANEYDAPIFRQFAFVDGTVTQYHVLAHDTFKTDGRISKIYQFPLCSTLAPVIERLTPIPDHPQGQTDSPTRQIVDVHLTTGCSVQPRSTEEADGLALAVIPRPMYVNAPIIPAHIADWPDEQLFNGPPFRPRVPAWQDGEAVVFITYETNWHPQWIGTKFPFGSAEVFIISYGATFREGFSILNVADSSPLTDSLQGYSPNWRANCIVDADDPKCMVSVNMHDPSYYQCRGVAECLSMTNSNGKPVLLVQPQSFTHINCPMVAVDQNGDDYISALEEIPFPSLWVNGPVIV